MKKIILGILVVLTAFLMPLTAFAAKENAKCNICVYYSSFITPAESDLFELTFKDSKGNEQSFEINAYSLIDSDGSIELPEGLYTIENLKYIGDGIINTYGFSVPSYFIAANDDTAKDIKIAIGHKEIKKMNNEDDSIKIYQDKMPLKDINSLVFAEEANEEIDWSEHPGNNYDLFDGEVIGQEQDLGEGYEHFNTDIVNDENELVINPIQEDDDPNEYSEPITLNNNEELPIIIEETKETTINNENTTNDTAKKSLITRIAILGVMIVIVGALLIVLKKKGTI